MNATNPAAVPLRRDAIDHAGKRYGELVVLSYAGRRYTPNGTPRTRWLCRCDCGAETTVDEHQLQRPAGAPGATRRCRACRDNRNRVFGRTVLSVRLSNGWTIAQVALAYGLDLNTVYRRWARGWPEDRLGDPVQPHGVRRFKAAPRLPCGLEPSQREATTSAPEAA